MEKRTALLIGSQRFGADPKLSPLRGPENDVRQFGDVLARSDLGAFTATRLVDRGHGEVLRALDETLSKATSQDLVLIYYSGHGKLSRLGHLFLTTTDTSLGALHSTSVPITLLRSMIDHSNVGRRVVLVLDCCFSGAAGRDLARAELADKFRVAGSGLYLLTSANEIQLSHEREAEGGGLVMGVFTRCVVEGLLSGGADIDGDGFVSLIDLGQYVQTQLSAQSPKWWGLDASGNIMISKNPHSANHQLPAALQSAIHSEHVEIREGAIHALRRLLYGRSSAQAFVALTELRALRTSSPLAARILDTYGADSGTQSDREVESGKFLVRIGAVTEQQVRTAMDFGRLRGCGLRESLIALGLADDERLADLISTRLGIPRIDLGEFELDPYLLALIPVDVMRRFQVLPLARGGSSLIVGMVDPGDNAVRDILRFKAGMPIEPVAMSLRGYLEKLEEVLAQPPVDFGFLDENGAK